MKKFLAFLLLICMAVSLSGCGTTETTVEVPSTDEMQEVTEVQENEELSVKVNGKSIVFKNEPEVKNGVLFVPAEEVCTAIGAEYVEESDSVITIIKNDILVTIIEGDYGVQDSVKGLWRANRYSIPQSPESKVTLYNDNDSNKSKAEMADQPFWKSGVFYVPLSVFSKDLGVNVIQSKDGGFIKVADTSYKRGEDERKSDREFSKEVADELFLKIPFDDEFDGTLNSQCGYNIKGKVYSYDDAYVDIYSDGTVNFLDSETGKITKTINVYDNEYKY